MKRHRVMTSPSIKAHHLLDSRYACFPSSNPRLGPDSQHAVAPMRQRGKNRVCVRRRVFIFRMGKYLTYFLTANKFRRVWMTAAKVFPFCFLSSASPVLSCLVTCGDSGPWHWLVQPAHLPSVTSSTLQYSSPPSLHSVAQFRVWILRRKPEKPITSQSEGSSRCSFFSLFWRMHRYYPSWPHIS